MLKKINIKLAIVYLLVLNSIITFAQDKVVIDRVIAVVGNSIILKSDIYNQKLQFKAQGIDLGENPFCEVLEESLYQKLLYNQAIIDSIVISEDQVEMVLDRRLRYFMHQIGSREKLEEHYGKTIDEIKDDFREIVREQELSQSMESQITRNVRVTPSEVNRFFNNLPEDSIPTIESQIQLSHIVIEPPIRAEEIQNVKRRLNEFRDRVLKGDDFSTLAILYSEDGGSSRRGGEIGFTSRGELYPEFEAIVFDLRPGEVSEVFETQAGYHIAQKIQRRGEQVNVRHILLRPKLNPQDIQNTINKLDSIRTSVINEEISFGEAASNISDDANKTNEGIMINPYNQTTRFSIDELDANLQNTVNRMEMGGISRPVPMFTEDGKQAYRIIYLRNRTEPKQANLRDNYDYIHRMALEQKQRQIVQKWINDKIKSTYLHITEDYINCEFSHNWIKNQISAE